LAEKGDFISAGIFFKRRKGITRFLVLDRQAIKRFPVTLVGLNPCVVRIVNPSICRQTAFCGGYSMFPLSHIPGAKSYTAFSSVRDGFTKDEDVWIGLSIDLDWIENCLLNLPQAHD